MNKRYEKTYMKEKERVQQIKDKIDKSFYYKYSVKVNGEVGCICIISDNTSEFQIYEGETVIRYQNADGMQIGEIRKDSAYTISPFRPRIPGNEDDTILEYAIKDRMNYSTEINNRVKSTVKSALYMLTDLGVELTDTERLQMLQMEKEDLEKELEEINKQIQQYGENR